MESDFEDNDYQEVPKFLRLFLQTFRNAIGDLTVSKYGAWANNNNNWFARQIAITIVWIFWFFNVLGMLIILINLLIS